MSDLQCPTTLIVARHGQAEYELDVWADAGGSLTRLGRTQAADLAAGLAGRKIAHVYTSTLARAVQTGEIVANRLGVAVTTREGLREFESGELAGTSMDVDPFVETYARWLAGDLDAPDPGRGVGARAGRADAVRPSPRSPISTVARRCWWSATAGSCG